MSGDDVKPLDPDSARIVRNVRRLMMLASVTTFVAIAAVIGVIGYRVFRSEGRVAAPVDIAPVLPAGAKVLSSAIGEGRIVLTVEVNGGVEMLSFDLGTLKPAGRVRLSPR